MDTTMDMTSLEAFIASLSGRYGMHRLASAGGGAGA
jgi:hypothetical protein